MSCNNIKLRSQTVHLSRSGDPNGQNCREVRKWCWPLGLHIFFVSFNITDVGQTYLILENYSTIFSCIFKVPVYVKHLWKEYAINIFWLSDTPYRFRVMALYSDNDSLQGQAQKFTLQSVGRQSLVTAPFIVEVKPVSEHAISVTWQVIVSLC